MSLLQRVSSVLTLGAKYCQTFDQIFLETQRRMSAADQPKKEEINAVHNREVWHFGCGKHGITTGKDFPPHCLGCEDERIREEKCRAP